MEKLNLDRHSLKKFAILMGIAFLILAVIGFLKQKNIHYVFGLVSAVFFILGFRNPELLKSVYIVWMKFAFVLGYINTRLLLIIVFYLVITPVSLVLKIFKKDILDITIDNKKDTYWMAKEKKQFYAQEYEKQY